MNLSILQCSIKKRLPTSFLYKHKSSLCLLNYNVPFSTVHDDTKYKRFLQSAVLPLTTESVTLTDTSDTTLPAILAANESFLYTVHDAGLPWWATIIASTLLLRSTMTLPIAIYQQRSLGKMINLAPIIQSWAETFKTQLAKESSAKGWNYQRYQSELQKQYRKKVNSIYAHYGCSRWKIVVLPWIQIPLFVSMSLTLRHITAFPLPWFGKTTNVPADGMLDGGLAWFVDLTATDSTMILPILIGAGNLINVELNAWYARGNQNKIQKIMTNSFRVLSIAFIPIAANIPTAMGLYWFTSAWYSVAQNIAFKIPSVRAGLKMPPLPKK